MQVSKLRTTYQGVKHAGLILLMCAVSTSASAHPHSGKSTKQANVVGTGCQVETDPAKAASQMQSLMEKADELRDPPEYDFTGADSAGDNPTKQVNLHADYRTLDVAGCTAKLRQWVGTGIVGDEQTSEGKYDDRPIGPTMHIGPGHTYQAQITNKLPASKDLRKATEHEHRGGHSGGESHGVLGYIPPKRTDINHNLNLSANSNEIDSTRFNVVNIHTHGWHVDPRSPSDDIFREMLPGGSVNEQRVYLPTYHPSGSFWYHSHVHGSTTIQVASGMAGALIVEDSSKGLDPILDPILGNTENERKDNDRIMVFQQLAYGEDGRIENYDNLQQGPYAKLNRPVFVNGQVYPKVTIKEGEVQRWRFIHAGMTSGINPQLVGVSNGQETPIDMYEIALDGFPTGKMPKIPHAVLMSGYRTDVLVQIKDKDVEDYDKFLLIDQANAKETVCIDKCDDQDKTNDVMGKNFGRVLAQIEVKGEAENIVTLPIDVSQALADYQDGNPYAIDEKKMALLQDITDEELRNTKTEVVHYLANSKYTCPPEGGFCTPCGGEGQDTCGSTVYMICDDRPGNNPTCMNFNSGYAFTRSFLINSANKWEISGTSNENRTKGATGGHIFHIHVNPFQVQRKYAYGTGYDFDGTGVSKDDWVWKDTLIAPLYELPSKDKPIPTQESATLKTRYSRYTGAFVQHCHVLHHEDRGMMQIVEIDPTLDHLEKTDKQLYDLLIEHSKAKK